MYKNVCMTFFINVREILCNLKDQNLREGDEVMLLREGEEKKKEGDDHDDNQCCWIGILPNRIQKVHRAFISLCCS